MQFQYITIAVSNLEKSKDFYENVLGFTPDGSYERWQSYEIEGNSGFGINEQTDLKRIPSLDIINFAIPDIDILWLKIKDHVNVESPPQVMPWGTKKLVILDPDDMRLGFVEK